MPAKQQRKLHLCTPRGANRFRLPTKGKKMLAPAEPWASIIGILRSYYILDGANRETAVTLIVQGAIVVGARSRKEQRKAVLLTGDEI